MAGHIPDLTPSTADPDQKILSIADLERAGEKRLSIAARDFYGAGATDQTTLQDNRTAFSKYRFRPRVLVDVANVDTTTTVFGDRKIPFPLSVAPAGMHGFAHPDGELATSRACAIKGICMGISSWANNSVDDIVQAAADVTTKSGNSKISHAIQMYTMRNRAMQERIIRRAEVAGCVAVFLTADSPVLGVRYNEVRNVLSLPDGASFPIVELDREKMQNQSHDDTFVVFNDATQNWAREIPWLRSITKMQIWIKGVLTAEDTELAVKHGCDGIIVSNHGGRQLDGTPATLDALPECVAAAEGKIPVHIDGGFRSGADVFKALALGAECCWVGRPAIWGLAYDGQAGVELMLNIMHDEFRRCMQLTGCRTVKDIKRSHLGRVNSDGIYSKLS